jgi:O-antigen/teichoic acid export membrane protein
LLKQLSIYNVATFVPLVVQTALLPIFTNYLTPTDYGVRAIVLLSILTFQVFSDLGTNWVIRSKYYLLKTNYEISVLVSTTLFLSLIIRLIFVILIFQTKDIVFSKVFNSWSFQYSFLLNLQSITFIFGFIRNTVLPILILQEKVKRYTLLLLSTFFVNIVVSLLLLIKYDLGITSLFYGELFGMVTFAIISFRYLKGYIKPIVNIEIVRYIIRVGLPALPKNLFNQIQMNINRYFIQLYMGVGDLGLFQKSEFLNKGFLGLLKSYGNVISPKNIKKLSKGIVDKKTGALSLLFIYFLSITVISLSFYLEDIFRIVGVNKLFWISAKYAPLYACNVMVTTFSIMFINNIVVSQKTKYIAYRSIIAGIINVVANILLIPQYGIVGAMVSVLISTFLGVLLDIYISEKLLSGKTLINYGVGLSILISTLIIYTLHYNGFILFSNHKLLIMFVYIVFLLLLDYYFVKAINWDKIKNKIVITS